MSKRLIHPEDQLGLQPDLVFPGLQLHRESAHVAIFQERKEIAKTLLNRNARDLNSIESREKVNEVSCSPSRTSQISIIYENWISLTTSLIWEELCYCTKCAWLAMYIQILYRLNFLFRKSAADKLGSAYISYWTFTLPFSYFLNCNALNMEVDL